MEIQDLNLFYEPKDRLRLTVGEERSYPTVKPAWAAPLSRPGKHLALLDGKGQEIVTISDPNTLPPASLEAVKEELHRRYLTATVNTITHAKAEFGATYWHVETDRGPRDFVTQSLQENAQWLSDNHLLLIDVDGNRFELPDIKSMDDRSRTFVETIL
jgi:hypothetical protein